METFTVIVKNSYADKNRNIRVQCEDMWLAHKAATLQTHQLKEEIISIKDSRNQEVYNLTKGFIFEEYK